MTLQESSKKMLDWYVIEEKWQQYAISEEAKAKITTETFINDPYLIQNALLETTEAKRILDMSSSVPLHGLEGVKAIIQKLKREDILRAQEFWLLAGFLKDCLKMKGFMTEKADAAPKISAYALSLEPLDGIYHMIIEKIYQGTLLDMASPALSRIRKHIERCESDIKSKLQGYLTSGPYVNMISEALISQRNGRYVIPVKSEHKKNFGGQILDRSRSGGTLFVEPEPIRKLHDTLNGLRVEEETEMYKILSILTNTLYDVLTPLYRNYECMVTYDYIFSKGKLSRSYEGTPPTINTSGDILINAGKHPMIGREAVPLNLKLTKPRRNLLITGPNTGGKTVTMKTIGLFCLMLKRGLHLPCEEGSELPIFTHVFCDIGDGQSVEQNLSTFSSHITNINAIIKEADSKSLIILDEIGSGTDPSEGMGIGIAVLEALNKKGATLLASTHYGEIKAFASMHPDFTNGSMGFDLNTLSPLYQLTLGEAGESSALHIALRLGMDKALVERAHELAHHKKLDYHHTETLPQAPDQPSLFVPKKESRFQVGDNVWIHTMKRTGIVVEAQNSKGDIGILVLGKKIKVNHKRLSMYIEGKELYPDDYNMDIVLKTKAQRKINTSLRKGHRGVIGDGSA